VSSTALGQARQLLAWEAPLGVVSICIEIDPGDRGGGWRAQLGNGLERLREMASTAEHHRKLALRATADRIAAHFEAREPPFPRCEVGFAEVAEHSGLEAWHAFHLPPPGGGAVTIGEEASLAPLLDLLGRSRRRAVALVSAERVRLLDWAPGELEAVADWELSLFSDDWRERKAQRPADPAGGHGPGASGRDQFEQRLGANRERFLTECGQLAAERSRERHLEDLFGFGPAADLGRFRAGVGAEPPRFFAAAERDLISVPSGELREPIAAAVATAELERDRELSRRVLDAARGGGRGSAGVDETAVALAEGRVAHLLIDRDGLDGAPVDLEALVRRAVATDAAVTLVSPAARGVLSGAGGVAALLRY
jgi:hypothetical protein